MAASKEELIREYSKAIREGNAAVFGGAGLSRASGYVDWKGLLRPLANDINLDIDKEHDLLSVAQFYQNKKGGARGGINQAIVNAFTTKDTTPSENTLILTRLPIFTYWTTNYDKMIETGIREANRNPDVKSEQEQLSVMMPDRDAIVYKMHGDVSNPAHAVLTKFDYELYEHTRPLFRTALKGDLVSKVFLFVGFSFEDPNLDYILSQIHSLLNEDIHNHYCFFKKIQRADCDDDEDYGYKKGKQEMQVDNLQKYGIQTVFVNSYDEITDILREIEHASKLHNVFVSGSADEFSDGWDEDSAMDLCTKLAKALVSEDYRITSGFGLGIGSTIVNGALDVIYASKFKHVDEHLCLRPFPQNIEDSAEREKRWREYREDMLNETGISIFLFGNKKDKATDKIINADGCKKEYEIAKQKGNLIIPVGSTGYAAKEIYDDVKSNLTDYPYLAKYIHQLDDEKDVDNLVNIIMEIVREVAKQ